MDKPQIEDISHVISIMDSKKIAYEIGHYLKAVKTTDALISHQQLLSDKDRKLYEQCCEAVEKEAAILISACSMSLNLILNFGFAAAGYAKELQTTFTYFKKLKSQQIELLMRISDDIEILLLTIRQSAKLRRMIQTHSETLQKYDYLTKVLRERMRDRPSTLLSGSGKKIKALNQTFEEMNRYERHHAETLQQQADQHTVGSEFTEYFDIINNSYKDIRQRQKELTEYIKELKQGWELLKSLALNGYSSRMDGLLKLLLSHHSTRQSAFSDQVMKCRQTLIF